MGVKFLVCMVVPEYSFHKEAAGALEQVTGAASGTKVECSTLEQLRFLWLDP